MPQISDKALRNAKNLIDSVSALEAVRVTDQAAVVEQDRLESLRRNARKFHSSLDFDAACERGSA